MALSIPRILLVGAGKFGSKHLATWRNLEDAGKVSLAGVVVRSEASKKKLKKEITHPVYTKLTDELLASVDGVDIATPMEMHHDHIWQTLPHCHVLVEKPLGMNQKELESIKELAKASKHKIMVGHTFRFHPAIKALKDELVDEKIESLEIDFIRPDQQDTGYDVDLELLHPYDIADYLTTRKMVEKFSETDRRLNVVGAWYEGGIYARFRYGWRDEDRATNVKVILTENRAVFADLDKGQITVTQKGETLKKTNTANQPSALETELLTFLDVISATIDNHPDAETAGRVTTSALHNQAEKTSNKKLRIAVIGAGIFGLNSAAELAPYADVTIFEKHHDVLTEASQFNQYRHHWGYHYPRSQETMDDIAATLSDFEERYESAIIRDFPTYYSVAKEGSKVSGDTYVKFCKQNNLAYEIEPLSNRYWNSDKLELTLKTYEPIYDFPKLKDITRKTAEDNGAKLLLRHEIIDASIDSEGMKVLSIKDPNGKIYKEKFDRVINVTYANHNRFCSWLNFPVKPIRLDLVEVTWVKLDLPKVSFAIMDGPFTNIVPTGMDNIFTLVHIDHSVRKRFVAMDGLIPEDIFTGVGAPITEKIIKESAEWLPFVKDAEVMSVHYVIRGVNAYREHDDARTSDITQHGFGCYSILGGKIIHAVSVGKEIKQMILGK